VKWRLLLWPLAVIYDGITRFRNHLYNIGHKPSFHFDVPVISVGNLNAGGSGKTPMIEYLVRRHSANRHIATLSRGYGRTTRGIRFASEVDDAGTIGDEPYQFLRKFGKEVRVVVGEERALAIATLLNEFHEVDTIFLDDAFQHRPIVPHFSILLTEYDNLFTRDFLLPAGNLREARKGASRADVVVITKCPGQIHDEVAVVDEVRKFAGSKSVFFSTVLYGKPIGFGNAPELEKNIVVVTGIAHPRPFINHMSDSFNMVRHFEFADHHRYRSVEIGNITRYAAAHNASIVTTEKDMVRLVRGKAAEDVKDSPWFYVPIEMVFMKNGAEFDQLVARSLQAPIFAS
jgi:tetraacyldisaccharide 4'-kinase